jgi:hypothetical protein
VARRGRDFPFEKLCARDGASDQGLVPRSLERNAHSGLIDRFRVLAVTGYVSASYVGTKGYSSLSQIAPINVADPRCLSLGAKLNDQFQPGDTQVAGIPVPFPGFATVMTRCAPSVARHWEQHDSRSR